MEPIIHAISSKATDAQLKEMAHYYGDRIKVGVDLKQKILAGGGAWHKDCKEILVQQGSDPADIWGGSYYPKTNAVDFLSHINIRTEPVNIGREIEDQTIRQRVEDVIRQRIT